MDDRQLAQLFKPVMQLNGVDPDAFTDDYIAAAVSLIKNRCNFVNDLWTNSAFFFAAPHSYAEKDVRKRWKEDTPAILQELISVLENLDDWSAPAAEPVVLDWIKAHDYHMGNVMNAFRLTVGGECKGPHMFLITQLLGKNETIARIKRGIDNIKPLENA